MAKSKSVKKSKGKAPKSMKAKSAKSATKTAKGKASKPAGKSVKPTAKANGKSKPTAKVNKTAKPLAKSGQKAKTALKVKAKATKTPVKSAVPSAAAAQQGKALSATLRSLASKLKPLDNRIVVQILSREKVTAGGLYIPDTASTEGHYEGEVLAVGPGHRDKKGRLRPTQLGVGDKVLFSQWAGDEIELQGHKVRILRESDVLGTLEK